MTWKKFAVALAIAVAATPLSGCSRREPPILRGVVKALVIRDRPVELGGVGQWNWTKYADDGKTDVSVYPSFIVIHQDDGSERIVPHGWYEVLELK